MDMAWIGLFSTFLLVCTKTTLSDTSQPNITLASDHVCRKCPPGYGVARECLIDTKNNVTVIEEDTMCAVCPDGTFNLRSTSDTNCTACKTCPEGFYEKTPCSPMADAVCISCSDKERGYGNEDFLKKCERTTTTLSTKLITKITSPVNLEETTEDEGSGEGSGEMGHIDNTGDSSKEIDGGFIPIIKTKSPLLKLFPSDFTIPTTVAAVEIKEVETAGASTQVWWIILIVLLALIGIFLLGFVVRKVRKRKSANLDEKSPPPNSDEPTVIDMNNIDDSKTPLKNGSSVPVNGTTSGPVDDTNHPDENTPMVSVQMPHSYSNATPSPANHTDKPIVRPASDIYRPGRKPKKSALKKAKSFGGSRDFSYIDEDSDDEVVKHVGRPPSVRYKERRGGKRSSNPLTFLNKLRRPRSSSEAAKSPIGNKKKIKEQKKLNASFDLEASLAKNQELNS